MRWPRWPGSVPTRGGPGLRFLPPPWLLPPCLAGMKMRLDAKRLRAEAEAHRARMESPLWTPSDGKSAEDWAAPSTAVAHASASPSDPAPAIESTPRPQPMAREPALEDTAQGILPRLDALDRRVEKLTEAVCRRSLGSEGFPG